MAFVELAKSVYQGQHKAKPKALTSVEEGKYVRIQKQAKERRSKRIETFFTNRDISDDDDILLTPQSENGPVPKKDVVSDPRKRQMLQWKEERMKRKKLEPKKPPPFKVGVVRHHIDPLQDVIFKNSVKGVTRVTRATAKAINNANPPALTDKSFAPANAVFHAPKVAIHNNKNLKNTPKNTRAKSGAPFKLTNVLNAIRPSKISNIKPFDFKYNMPKAKSPIKVKKTSGASKVKRQSGKLKRNNLVGISKDKRLDMKKGKRASMLRRSLRKSIDIQCGSKQTLDNLRTLTPENKEKVPVCTPTNKRLSRIISKPLEMSASKLSDKSVTPNEEGDSKSSEDLVISSPFVTVARGKCSQRRETLVKMQLGFQVMSPEKTAQYFRLQLEREIERLQSLCDKWKTYQSSHQELSEDSHDLINLAVGQTQLLMNKKLQQFRGLVVRCESKEEKEGEGIVTSQDLQGFWDMVYMQVENVDLRFQKLDEMERKNWVEDDVAPKVKRNNKKAPVKAPKPQNENPKATSSLKAMIQAARKKTKMSESIPTAVPSTLKPDTITFNGGFFSVVSPVKNGADGKTNTMGKRASLLKATVEMEAKKKLSSIKTPESSKAIMKASRISKNITSNMDMLIAVDLKKTPAKSILKTPAKNNTSVKKGPRKSLKVLFSDCSEDSVEDVAYKRDISVLEETRETELNKGTEHVLVEDLNLDKNRKRGKLKRQRAVSKECNDENTPPKKPLDVENADSTPNVYNMRKRKSEDRHLLESNLDDINTDIKPSRRSKRKLTNETELKSLLPPDPDESAKVKRPNRKSFEERKSINLISFSPEQPKQHTRYALRRMSMNVS